MKDVHGSSLETTTQLYDIARDVIMEKSVATFLQHRGEEVIDLEEGLRELIGKQEHSESLIYF